MPKQILTIKKDDVIVKTFELPALVRVYYTFSTTAIEIVLSDVIGVYDESKDCIMYDELLKEIKTTLEENMDCSLIYQYDDHIIDTLTITKATYIAYRTRTDNTDSFVEELEIMNSVK